MRISVGSGTSVVGPEENNGRLQVTPAYYQTSGAQDVQLDSADKWIGTKIVPRTDFELQALSRHVNAVSSQGNGTLEIYSDGTRLEPNGAFNDSETRCHDDMTGPSSPSPLVAAATSEDGTNYAYKAFDNPVSVNNWRSTVDPAVTPQSLTLDLGGGNETIVNKIGMRSKGSEYPEDFSLWGSNLASPDKDTDGDWTQLYSVTGIGSPGTWETGWFVFTNGTAYRHYRLKVTKAGGTPVSVVELFLVEAQEESAPGSSLRSLGTLSSGSVPGWTRLAISEANRYQFQRGNALWIVEKGEASKDYSVSKRRWNTACGSMFPDEMIVSKESEDGGTSWTVSLQDDMLALWNIILNSTSDHVPQLMFGRFDGKRINISGSPSPYEIPEEGVLLDCSSLSVINQGDTPYNIFIYDNSGTLTLEASTTSVAVTDGIEHKSGDASRKFLGIVAPRELQSGVQGPVDVPDLRLVENRFNQPVKTIGKACPYTTTTYWYPRRGSYDTEQYEKWSGNDDWMVEFVSLDRQIQYTAVCTASGGGLASGIALDNSCRMSDYSSSCHIYNATGQLTAPVENGVHYVIPVAKSRTGAAYVLRFRYETNAALATASCYGLLVMR